MVYFYLLLVGVFSLLPEDIPDDVPHSNIHWDFVDYPGLDVNYADGTVLHSADWSPECDPWKVNKTLTDANYDTEYAGWICPDDMRSISGCGDFRDDPREDVCDEEVTPQRCSDVRLVSITAPVVSQMHACVQHPLYYFDDLSTSEVNNVPPMIGRHRERWPKYGEYEFCPEQRWLHAAEHGAVIFLYNPCLSAEALCQLRQYISTITHVGVLYGDDATMNGRDAADEFRYILTPYKHLRTSYALITWQRSLFSKCMNEPAFDDFIFRYYRQGWEDWPPSGAYDYLWVDYQHDDSCPALTETPWRDRDMVTGESLSIEHLTTENEARIAELEARLDALESQLLVDSIDDNGEKACSDKSWKTTCEADEACKWNQNKLRCKDAPERRL